MWAEQALRRVAFWGVGAKNACNNLVLEIISSSCFHLIFMFVFGKGILNHNFF